MWQHESSDPATRIGNMIGTVFVAIFAVFMVWGLFVH
jgi:hypothetical protein